MYMKGKNN